MVRDNTLRSHQKVEALGSDSWEWSKWQILLCICCQMSWLTDRETDRSWFIWTDDNLLSSTAEAHYKRQSTYMNLGNQSFLWTFHTSLKSYQYEEEFQCISICVYSLVNSLVHCYICILITIVTHCRAIFKPLSQCDRLYSVRFNCKREHFNKMSEINK